MRKIVALAAGALMAVSAAPGLTQNSGLVVVDLANADINVLNNLARNLNVQVSDITALNNVSIPVGLAAAVCPEINANVLARGKKTGDGPVCRATNSTTALQRAVQEKLDNQNN